MLSLFILILGISVFSLGLIRYYYNIESRLDELEERMIFK